MKENNQDVPSMHGNYFKTAGKASEVATCEVLRDRQECTAVLAYQTALFLQINNIKQSLFTV